MKRLKPTIPNGGSPLGQYPVLREIFDEENKDAIEAILTSITDGQTQGVILSGCVAAGATPNGTLTAGFVYLDGKVLRLPAQTGLTWPVYIAEAAATEEGGVFADSVTRQYIDVEEAEVVTSIPGAGQYVTITDQSTQGRTLLNALQEIENTNEAWTSTGFSYGTGASAGIAGAPEFYKDRNGVVHLRGGIVKGSTTTLGTLPAGYRPQETIALTSFNEDTETLQVFVITTGGSISSTLGLQNEDISFIGEIMFTGA
jgi:hypothetical protein